MNSLLVPTLKYLQVVRQALFTSRCFDFLSGVMESRYRVWGPMNPIYSLILSKLDHYAEAVCSVYHYTQENHYTWETGREIVLDLGDRDAANK